MLSKYGLASSVAAGQYNIASAPLYFVRSGVVDPPGVSGGTFRYAGIYGYWWSSRTYSSSTHAYNLVITSGVNSSSEGVRYVGFSLRCLSTVLDM